MSGGPEYYGQLIGLARVYDEDETSPTGWKQVGGDLIGSTRNGMKGIFTDISDDGNRIVTFEVFNRFPQWTPYASLDNIWVTVMERDPLAPLGWRQIGRFERRNEDTFGNALAFAADGRFLAIGSYDGNDPDGVKRGHVEVYEYTVTSVVSACLEYHAAMIFIHVELILPFHFIAIIYSI